MEKEGIKVVTYVVIFQTKKMDKPQMIVKTNVNSPEIVIKCSDSLQVKCHQLKEGECLWDTGCHLRLVLAGKS